MDKYPFYPDRDKLIVEHDSGQTTESCERIPLDYPDLRGRAEVCMGRSPNGDIYAAVAAACGAMGESIQPTQRLFRSSDGGYTWSSWPIALPVDGAMAAFTVLPDVSRGAGGVQSYVCVQGWLHS